MTPLKIAIVEDEMITAESLSDMLEELGYEVTRIYIRAEKAWEAFAKDPPDFALLDINLKGEKTGIWLAEQIQQSINIPYVFLTSYGDKDTIQKATATNPYGYLLKPIEKQHLYASIEVAINKFHEISGKGTSVEEQGMFLKDALFIKDEYLFIKVRFEDIYFVKASGNYLEIHTADKKYLIKGTLSSFCEALPAHQFFQTHRSYLLNLERIEAFGGNYVKIKEQDLPLTQKNKEDLIKQIQLYQKR